MHVGRTVSIAFGLALAATASADECSRIRADIDTTITAEACTSPYGLCAVGQVSRNQLLGGSTWFVGEALGGGAVGEASVVTPPIEPDTTWTYAGTLVITTDHGTLTLEDIGVLDTANRPYTEIQRVIDGTGVFQGASGTLFSYGWTREDGSGFSGRLRGKICWADVHHCDRVDDQDDDDVAELPEGGE